MENRLYSSILIIGVSAATFLCVWYLSENNKPTPNVNDRVLAPGKLSAWFAVIAGTMIILGGVWLLRYENMTSSGAVVFSFFGLLISGFMSPSLGDLHDVIWNDEYVEGPSKMFGPSLGTSRIKAYWSEVVGTGATSTGYTYLKTVNGERIYWSYLYPGHQEFEVILADRINSN